jgi:pilus assembly protein FimV
MSQKMRLNTNPKTMSFALKTLNAAVISALLFTNAAAAGLGKMTVQSALGQPLRAEIELTSVSDDEAGLLNPKLASIEAFRQANIEYNASLRSLHFAIETRSGGRQVISVTSAQPINDPFVDMLLEMGGNGSSRLVREYTFLLDPPSDLRNDSAPEVSVARPSTPLRVSPNSSSNSTQAQAQVPSPSPSPSPARTQGDESSTSDRPSQVARTSRTPQERPIKSAVTPTPTPAPASPQHTAQQGDYQVKTGDTLSKIAGQVKPDGISLDQMLVALYRANSNAFVGKNMNRLRAGQVLTVPDAASAGETGNAEAHSVVVAQTADFNEYRNKLAGQVVNSEAQKSTEARQSASGKITAKVEEKSTAAAEAKDKLKLSKAGVPGEKGGKIAQGEEDKIAKEKAIAEANARVKQLEKNVSDLQKVLEVKNKNLADQQKAEAAKAAVKPVAPTPTPAPTPAPAPVAVVKPTPEAASVPAQASKAAPEAKPEVKPEPVVAAAPPVGPKKPKPRPVPPPETSLFDDLIGNPLVWGGIAVLGLVGGGFGIYSGYRKRKEKSFGDSIITDSSLKANSLFGSTGGQSVDTNNSVFNSNFAPSASQLDSNEVDPVAEADVYIAYGRDAQAEEILKEALRTQPDRHAVRVKLLEIYANRKDLRSFEVMASELYGLTKGEGEDWQQAASLGLSIDPKNPLYASGSTEDAAKSSPMDDSSGQEDFARTTRTRSMADTTASLEEAPFLGSTTVGRLDHDTVTRQPDSHAKSTGDLPLDVNTSLDFDLDGMDSDHAETPAMVDVEHMAAPATESAAVVDSKMDVGNIDFDFLNNTTEKAPEPEVNLAEDFPSIPAAPAHVEPEVPSMPEVPAMNFHEEPVTAAPAPAPSAALEFDLSGITLELNQGDKPAAPAVAKKTDEPMFDLHVPDIPSADLHVPEMKQADMQAPELHAMDLHLPDSHPVTASAPAAPTLHSMEPSFDMVPDLMMHQAAESEVALDTGVDHEYSNNAEMATKLDLAVAYQEIGDKEGARELLEEVIQGGASEHSDKAKELLAKLG